MKLVKLKRQKIAGFLWFNGRNLSAKVKTRD